jgi:hypothetical protein
MVIYIAKMIFYRYMRALNYHICLIYITKEIMRENIAHIARIKTIYLHIKCLISRENRLERSAQYTTFVRGLD